jgi:hypothetical protein
MAVIGGILTGWYALRAQRRAAADQRQRDEGTECRTLEGTLPANGEYEAIWRDRIKPLHDWCSTRYSTT